MEECYNRKMLTEVTEINMSLTEKLASLLNLRVEHAKLQLSVAKLYTSECTEILNEWKEMLKEAEEKDSI